MTLTAGARLGAYEILSAIGAGGMGEVYRARDTKLKRDVALKVLPEVFTLDPDRVARFTREAEVLASLNHPNIAAIYGVEECIGVQALVLELVEGPTLADRLRQGALALGHALSVARQIAEALEAAHEHGIVHRDLKPANIKLRPDGAVKVLDFGLAKPLEPTSNRGDLTQSPTVSSAGATAAGVIMGTASYMSPEQARGMAVDRRTDIWAFGCVLFEMLAGRKAFHGETLADVFAAIIKGEPDWRALPRGTPARIQSLVARCLKTDPAQRLHDVADARFQLEDALSDPPIAIVTPARNARQWAGWIAAALCLGALSIAVSRPTTVPPGDLISLSVLPPGNAEFSARVNTTLNVPSFALSPDGRALVFSAHTPGSRPVLWLRAMDRVEIRPLPGTEGAEDPFWSPDGRWIGFFADGTLRKVPADGGTVQLITQQTNYFRNAAWGARDTILLAGRGSEGLVSINAAGGSLTPVTAIDRALRENTHRNPSFLPDGVHFLYTVLGDGHESGVYVGSLDSKAKKRLVPHETSAVYAPPGYLLFVTGGTLFAQPFDLDRLELTGQPSFVAAGVARSTNFMSAVSASSTGTIAYAGALAQAGRLTWMDRRGTRIGSPAGTSEGDYTDFRLSPDETALAASLADPKSNIVDIWMTDLARGSTSRLGSGGAVTAAAVWSPDGTRLAFRSNRTGVIELYERSTAGGGVDRPILSRRAFPMPIGLIATDWSPDGRQLICMAPALGSGDDLWVLPLDNDATPTKFVDAPGSQMHGNFSPDGRLVAYASNESGRFEVYVETYPRSDRKWPVSTNGGYEPRWRADGREIYYLSDDRTLMAVSVAVGPSFGVPKPLFQTEVRPGVTPYRTHYVPSRNGERFLVNVSVDKPVSPITVVLNWTEMLRK